MRGKEKLFNCWDTLGRITPAYAGKSGGTPETAGNQRDHPRLCGEKTATHRAWKKRRGSPPPMRGKANAGHTKGLRNRITPAYAGKRHSGTSTFSKIKDHPRLCGEKSLILCTSYNRKGSPPPMRGKAHPRIYFVKGKRITPAYAGKRRVAGKKYDAN